MKLHVLFDGQGNIVAAARPRSGASVSAIPVATERGHRVAEIDVPREHEHEDLATLHRQFGVDVEARDPALKRRG